MTDRILNCVGSLHCWKIGVL